MWNSGDDTSCEQLFQLSSNHATARHQISRLLYGHVGDPAGTSNAGSIVHGTACIAWGIQKLSSRGRPRTPAPFPQFCTYWLEILHKCTLSLYAPVFLKYLPCGNENASYSHNDFVSFPPSDKANSLLSLLDVHASNYASAVLNYVFYAFMQFYGVSTDFWYVVVYKVLLLCSE